MVVKNTVVTQWYVFYYSFATRSRNYIAVHSRGRTTLRKPWLLCHGSAGNNATAWVAYAA
jgi:hypothetical protein